LKAIQEQLENIRQQKIKISRERLRLDTINAIHVWSGDVKRARDTFIVSIDFKFLFFCIYFSFYVEKYYP